MRKKYLYTPLLITLVASPLIATETTTYSYDVQGRLTQTAKTGTVNNGVNTTISLDPAGNRSNYSVSTTGGGQSPIANPDTVSIPCPGANPVNVLANDSSPNGYTLTVTSVSPTSGSYYAQIPTGAPAGTVVVTATAPSANNALVQYTINDGHGGTASSTIKLSLIIGQYCK